MPRIEPRTFGYEEQVLRAPTPPPASACLPIGEVHLELEVGGAFRRKSENDSPKRNGPTFVAELVAGGGDLRLGRLTRTI